MTQLLLVHSIENFDEKVVERKQLGEDKLKKCAKLEEYSQSDSKVI